MSTASNTHHRQHLNQLPKTLRLRPIAAICSGLFFFASASYAQEQIPAQEQKPAEAQSAAQEQKPAEAQSATATQAKPADDVQTVVVTGIRHSVESSIAAKRNSNSIVEAITAEDIGKLPDVSIAESLSRLPGLAAQNVNGRAQVIAIRGMSPDFAGTLLNGREQTTTGLNRGVEFDQYPAELMSGAVVYKTPDATLLGQGISGTVDLHTVRPLDIASRKLVANARGELNSQGDQNHGAGGTSDKGGRLSAAYIDQFADRTIGVAVGFAHLDAPGQEQHYKSWWWGAPGAGFFNGATAQGGAEVTAVSRRDKRDGLMGTVEYKPNDNLHSTVDAYYSRFNQTEVMSGLMWDSNPWGGYPITNPGFSPAGNSTILSSGTITFPAGANQPVVRNDSNARDDHLLSLGWNTEAKIADWKGIADLSYSSAKRNETLFETYAGTPTSSMQFNIPVSPGFPTYTPSSSFTDPNTVALGDPGHWGHDGRLQNMKQDDVIKAINLHAKRDLTGLFSQIDSGVDYSMRDKTRAFQVFFAQLRSGTSQLISPSLLRSPTSLGFSGVPGVLSYDPYAIASQYYNMVQNMSGGAGGDYSKNYGVHEKITTVYSKADIETELATVPLHGNLGAQLIHTDQSSNAFAFNPASNAVPLGSFTSGTTYNDFLPSLNLVGDVASNRKLRFGLAKTLARPRIDDMNAATSSSVDPVTHLWSGGGGNPKLKPWRATAIDLSLEQYWGKRSYVAGAVFYKELQSYIYNKTVAYDFTNFINPTPSVVPVSNMGQYTTQSNGSGGYMKGFEFSAALEGDLLSRSLDGFGALFSYSYTESSIKVNGPGTATPIDATLPGLSKDVAGLQLYYEKNGFSARINDRYRSAFRGEFNSLFGATSVVRTLAQNKVDFQTAYEFQEGKGQGVSVMFQIVNLTNAPDRTVQDGTGFGGATAPMGYSTFGRQYLLGLNYKM